MADNSTLTALDAFLHEVVARFGVPRRLVSDRGEFAAKLARKRLDLIVGNDVSAPGTGFAHDTNAVVILDADGNEHLVPLATKREVAEAVWDAVVARRA